MTEKGEKIHAYWFVLVATFVVLEKMTRKAAERKAYDIIVKEYGETTLMKELQPE